MFPTTAVLFILRQAAMFACGWAASHNLVAADQLSPLADAIVSIVAWAVPAAVLAAYSWIQRIRLKRASIADVARMHPTTTTIHTDPATAAAVNLPNVVATPPAAP